VAILDRRVVKKQNQAVVEVLLKWSNLHIEDATWEEYDQMKLQFDLSKFEDKLKNKGRQCQHTAY
jgi:Chromo (CHRromatin Organisation MOdifier) domain